MRNKENSNIIDAFKTPSKQNYPELKQVIDDNFDKVLKIYNRAKEWGLDDNQIAGLLGNMSIETGGTFNHEKKQDPTGPGFGLIQHEVGTARYNRFMKNVKNPNDFYEQLDYILSNFFEEETVNSQDVWGGTGKQDIWWNSDQTTPEKVAESISRIYLRPSKPNLNQRIISARYIFDKINEINNNKIFPDLEKPDTNYRSLPKYVGMKQKNWLDPNSEKYMRNGVPIRTIAAFKQEGGSIDRMKKTKIKIGDKKYTVRLAISDEDKEKGLQGIRELPNEEGMLFIFDDVQEVSFWMKDTYLPLDVVFIDEEMKVISIRKGIPESTDFMTEKNVNFVLEVTENSGIKINDELEFLLKNEKENTDTDKMLVLDSKGEVQMELEGGERIFSRKNTKTLIKFAKKAYVTERDSDFKALGKRVFKFLETQDSNEPEYVKGK